MGRQKLKSFMLGREAQRQMTIWFTDPGSAKTWAQVISNRRTASQISHHQKAGWNASKRNFKCMMEISCKRAFKTFAYSSLLWSAREARLPSSIFGHMSSSRLSNRVPKNSGIPTFRNDEVRMSKVRVHTFYGAVAYRIYHYEETGIQCPPVVLAVVTWLRKVVLKISVPFLIHDDTSEGLEDDR